MTGNRVSTAVPDQPEILDLKAERIQRLVQPQPVLRSREASPLGSSSDRRPSGGGDLASRASRVLDHRVSTGLRDSDAPQTTPHARLLELGAGALDDLELLAVVLGPPSRADRSLAVAHTLLTDRRLQALPRISVTELAELGLSPAARAALLAALELPRRIARPSPRTRLPLQRPDAIVHYLCSMGLPDDQEEMGALYLDARHRLIEHAILFRGTLNRSCVDPRPILARALRLSAVGFILHHNHPSGDPAPSAEDILFSRRLKEASDHVGFQFLDHLVIASGERWVSLRQRGAF